MSETEQFSVVRLDQFALSRVQTGTHLEPEIAHAFADRAGTANRAGRPVERGEEAVAVGVELAATETKEACSTVSG
jgi:hypothetical protein